MRTKNMTLMERVNMNGVAHDVRRIQKDREAKLWELVDSINYPAVEEPQPKEVSWFGKWLIGFATVGLWSTFIFTLLQILGVGL